MVLPNEIQFRPNFFYPQSKDLKKEEMNKIKQKEKYKKQGSERMV